jgi:hypothetical protein
MRADGVFYVNEVRNAFCMHLFAFTCNCFSITVVCARIEKGFVPHIN